MSTRESMKGEHTVTQSAPLSHTPSGTKGGGVYKGGSINIGNDN